MNIIYQKIYLEILIAFSNVLYFLYKGFVHFIYLLLYTLIFRMIVKLYFCIYVFELFIGAVLNCIYFFVLWTYSKYYHQILPLIIINIWDKLKVFCSVKVIICEEWRFCLFLSILTPFYIFSGVFSLARNSTTMLIRIINIGGIFALWWFIRKHFCHFNIKKNNCWIWGLVQLWPLMFTTMPQEEQIFGSK